MLILRNTLIRTVPAYSSSALAARNARSFSSIISPSSSSTSASCSSVSRLSPRSNIFALAARRSYATEGEDKPTKETFESAYESTRDATTGAVKQFGEEAEKGAETVTQEVKEVASNVMGAVQNAGHRAMGYAKGEGGRSPRRNYDGGSSYGSDAPRRGYNSEGGGRGSFGGGRGDFGGGRGDFGRERRGPPRPERTEQVEPSAEECDGNLYVSNMSFDVPEATIRKEFEAFGPLESFRIIKDPSGLSKGFGFAKFESIDDAVAAREGLGDKEVDGRRLNVRYSVTREKRPAKFDRMQNPPSKTLFLGNIPYSASTEDLNVLFEKCPGVLDVRVAVDRRTGNPRGFAHADFQDVPSAEAAAEWLQTQTFQERRIKVDFATRAD